MKILGMQYPLPARPISQRSEHLPGDVEVSDDAVYFEPDERRQNEEQHDQQAAEQKHEKLEHQVSSEKVKGEDPLPVAGSEKEVRPAINIIV